MEQTGDPDTQAAPVQVKQAYLRRDSGLRKRQEATLARRYCPKGGFVKVYEEIVESKSSPDRVAKPGRTVVPQKYSRCTEQLTRQQQERGSSPAKCTPRTGAKPAVRVAAKLCHRQQVPPIAQRASLPEQQGLPANSQADGEQELESQTLLVGVDSSWDRPTLEAAEDEGLRHRQLQMGQDADQSALQGNAGRLLQSCPVSMVSRDQMSRLRSMTEAVPSNASDNKPQALEGQKSLNKKIAESKELKGRLQNAAASFESEKAAFAFEKEEWRKRRDSEGRQLKLDRAALDMQSRMLARLPTRKEKSEVESLASIIEAERKESRAKDARHKLTVERLRRQIMELQGRVAELQEVLQWHELRSLADWTQDSKQGRAAVTPHSTGCQRPSVVIQHPSPKASHSQALARLPIAKGARGASITAGRQAMAGKENSGTCSGTAGKGSLTQASHVNEATRCLETRIARFLLDDDETVPTDGRMTCKGEVQAIGLASVDTGSSNVPSADSSTRPPDTAREPPSTTDGSGYPQAAASELHESEKVSGASLGNSTSTLKRAAEGPFQTQKSGQLEVQQAGDSPGAVADSSTAHPHLQHEQHGKAGSAQRQAICDKSAFPSPVAPVPPGTATSPGHADSGSGQPEVEVPLEHSDSVLQCTLPMSAAQRARLQGCAGPQLRPPTSGKQPSQSSTQRGSAAWLLTKSLCLPASDFTLGRLAWDSNGSPDLQQPSGSETYRPSGNLAKLPEENRLADDRKESLYPDCQETRFRDGTVKLNFLGDGCCIVKYANGDVQKTLPNGRIEYFYAKAKAWQVSCDAVEIYFFQNGQREAHHPDGTKEIISPNGTCSISRAAGHEQMVSMDALSAAIKQPCTLMTISSIS